MGKIILELPDSIDLIVVEGLTFEFLLSGASRDQDQQSQQLSEAHTSTSSNQSEDLIRERRGDALSQHILDENLFWNVTVRCWAPSKCILKSSLLCFWHWKINWIRILIINQSFSHLFWLLHHRLMETVLILLHPLYWVMFVKLSRPSILCYFIHHLKKSQIISFIKEITRNSQAHIKG